MSAPSSAAATNGTAADLPYGGDVQAAAKAQDREAIRTIMAWRTAKERGEAPPAAPAPAPPAAAPAAAPAPAPLAPAPPAPAPEPAEALAAAAAAAPTRRSLSDLVAEQDKRAPPPPAPAPAGPPPSILGAQAPAPSILGNNAADGWAASEPAPPATIDKLKATLAAEVAKADESTKMATEDAPQDGMAAHDKAAAAAVAAMAAGRAPPPPPPQVSSGDASEPRAADVTCKPCKSPLLEGVADENNEEDAAAAYAKAKAKGDAASEAANAANKAKKALEEKPKPLTGAAAKAAYRAAIEARQKAAQASQPKADKKKKEKKVRPQCHLRGRRDGVFMRPRRLDDAAVRESTRDGVGPRAGQEGQEGRQGPRHTRRGHPIHGYGPKTHPGDRSLTFEPLERLLQGPPRHPEEGLRRGPVDRY
jgi:hypothetical protein